MNSLNHVAFIMDGNGRWGEKKRKGRNYGHLKGLDTVKDIVGCCVLHSILDSKRRPVSGDFQWFRRSLCLFLSEFQFPLFCFWLIG